MFLYLGSDDENPSNNGLLNHHTNHGSVVLGQNDEVKKKGKMKIFVDCSYVFPFLS